MTLDDLTFTPCSDMEIEDVPIVNEHNNLIKENKFSDANTLLKTTQYKKGIIASLFNCMEEKIRNIQVYLLNKQAAPDELYSYTEPTPEQMEGKLFWIKPID